MAGLEINNQFFNEAFSKLKEEQKQLKNEVPWTASDKLEEKFNLQMKDIELSNAMKKILWKNEPVEWEARQYAPIWKRITRKDDANWNWKYWEDSDWLNLETSLTLIIEDWMPIYHEWINFYLLNGTKEINLNYEDSKTNTSFTISKTEWWPLILHKTDKVKEWAKEWWEQFESITLQWDNIKAKIIAQIDIWFGSERRTINKSPTKPFWNLQEALEILIS